MKKQPLVLLVDDEEAFLEIVSRKLKGCGLESASTTNTRDALKQAEELQPALVLSDVMISPDSNGFEFALSLKRNPRTSDIKCVFLTSLSDPWRDFASSREKIVAELGDVIFFDKCNDIDLIGTRVLSLLEK